MIAQGSPNKAGTQRGARRRTRREKWRQPAWQSIGHIRPSKSRRTSIDAWDARKPAAAPRQRGSGSSPPIRYAYPAQAKEFERRTKGELPADFARRVRELMTQTNEKAQSIATRKVSQDVLEGTRASPSGVDRRLQRISPVRTSRSGVARGRSAPALRATHLHYGVREFRMAAIMNGLALHGAFIPTAAPFLTFSDYCRSALRMAALH